jgi:phospholipase C
VSVFIIKENRTFDHYFGGFPAADGATSGTTAAGQSVELTDLDDCDEAALCNSWSCSLQRWPTAR